MFKGPHYYLRNSFVENTKERLWKPEIELYEVFRVINSVPLFLEDHLLRLEGFFEEKDLAQPYSDKGLREIITAFLERSGLKNGNIRISFDLSDPGLCMALGEIPSVYPEEKLYKNGVNAVILHEERIAPNLKIYQKELRKKAQDLMHQNNAFDVILCNRSGEITEGSRTNVFGMKGNILFTSRVEQVLPGITRQKILKICKKAGMEVKIERIPEKMLLEMDAVFFSGTSPGVLPIRNIASINYDVKSPMMLKIRRLYDDEVRMDLLRMSQKMSKKLK